MKECLFAERMGLCPEKGQGFPKGMQWEER